MHNATHSRPDQSGTTVLTRTATAAALALTLSLGSMGAASAAPVTPSSTAVVAGTSAVSPAAVGAASGLTVRTVAAVQTPKSPVIVPKRHHGKTLKKTGSYIRCITQVGVPIGFAIAALTNPAFAAYLVAPASAPLPANAGGTVGWYLKSTKKHCRYAILG